MGITRLNPEGLPPPGGYSQLTVAEGTRIVHVSGQVGIGPDGELAGHDHASQAERAMGNLRLALDAAGASSDDVAKTTFYIVDLRPEVIGALFQAYTSVFGPEAPVGAVTLVGVAGLFDPRCLIEIEATAVLS